MEDSSFQPDHPEDLPWHDAPADRILPAMQEPAPAEVVERGDDEQEVDLAAPHIPEPYEKYERDTLAQRLAEEEPDTWPGRPVEPEVGGLLAPEAGEPDVVRAEADTIGDGGNEAAAAEDAAVHVSSEVRRP